jgi:3-phosphoshikimate 1-carboxyvinyltransferase
LLVKDVGLNTTRTGILAVLVRMGAHVREVIGNDGAEPMGAIEITGANLRGTVIGGREIPNVIDELPVLAVAGALAQGRTVIKDAKELRVKETDRIAAIAGNLRAMGVEVVETEDGMEINGGAPLHGAVLESFGDHRIAMAFAIAGWFAEGETVITGTECVATSYPGFDKELELALKRPRTPQTPVITQLH